MCKEADSGYLPTPPACITVDVDQLHSQPQEGVGVLASQKWLLLGQSSVEASITAGKNKMVSLKCSALLQQGVIQGTC